MSYIETHNQTATDSTENNSGSEATELTERIPLMDEAIMVIWEKNAMKQIVENGDVPEDSPIRARLRDLQDEQKEQYKLRKEQVSVNMPDYLEALGRPPQEANQIDLDEWAKTGLYIHPDYSDDGRCYANAPDNHDDYGITEDFEVPAYYPEESDEQDKSEDPSSDLTTVDGIGDAIAERLISYGIETREDLENNKPEDLLKVKGLGERVINNLGMEMPEESKDSEESEEEADSDSEAEAEPEESNDEMGKQIAAYLEDNPEVALEALRNAL